jgi:xanthine dehydrogenase YagR molybdenum-binding subunit
MPNTWPKNRRLLGTKVQRLDGPEKSTGRAKYSFDINRPGLLHAKVVRCPYAHAKLKSVDLSAAEKVPGFKASHMMAKPGAEFNYAGEEILAIAADTEEHLADAMQAVKLEFEELPFYVKEEDGLKAFMGPDGKLKPGSKATLTGRGNLIVGNAATVGDVEAGFKEADAIVEGEYGAHTISHQCLESHGTVAEWDKEGNLTVWCSTQATTGVVQDLARAFKIPQTKVRCITHYMGGGFGSKFNAYAHGIACAELAKKAGAPVKLMLDRSEEITTAGNRPSAYGKVKIGGKKDGSIVAYEVDCYGSPGVGSGSTVNLNVLPYVYAIPNVRRKHTVIRLNHGGAQAMRAPGHPQNCILTEGAVDELAAKLGLDPMEVRKKNLPQNLEDSIKSDPTSWNAIRHTTYLKQFDRISELSGWKQKWHAPGKGPGAGPVKHGIGMAIHTWGGAGGGPNDMFVTIASDGSVLVQASTQDLGTGARTVLAIIAAEVLGLQPTDITVRIGESQYGRSTGSGGSTTCPGTSPAILNAASAARDSFLEKIAARFGSPKEDLAIEAGKIVDKKAGKSKSWREACALLGMDSIKGQGNWTSGLSNNGVGGMQVAEVMVDSETGVVRCTKFYAVQDCGLIVNKLCCESQVAGGVVMGLNYALFEENILDRVTGRQVNPDMEFYKLGGIEDMPHITVEMMDMPERGVIGIGEPPTISTAAAISNAIYNAIGVRVPFAPFTPDRVLAALSKQGANA